MDGEKIEGNQIENRQERKKPMRKILRGKRGSQKKLILVTSKKPKIIGFSFKNCWNGIHQTYYKNIKIKKYTRNSKEWVVHIYKLNFIIIKT